MREKEIQESGKVFALTAVLVISLILVSIGGVLWLVQMILMQISQLNAMLNGFRM
jgi:hypothetical protein